MLDGSNLSEPAYDQLVKAVGADSVLVGDQIAPVYFGDENLERLLQPPAAVVLPRDTRDVSAVVAIAAAHGIPVTARGAGTGLSGACIPRPGGMVVSFERMAALREIDTLGHVADRRSPG